MLLARTLTFLQSLDLLLREAGPVPLQLPLELQPQLRLLAFVPLHRNASYLAWPSSTRLSTHAALGVQQTTLGHCKGESVKSGRFESEHFYRKKKTVLPTYKLVPVLFNMIFLLLCSHLCCVAPGCRWDHGTSCWGHSSLSCSAGSAWLTSHTCYERPDHHEEK